MNRVFWILILVEVAVLAAVFVAGLKSPSESGGREMGLGFGVVLPGVVLVFAALVYANASSSVAKNIAMGIAAAPVLILIVIWGRGFSLDSAVAGSMVKAFHDPGQRVLAKAIAGNNVSKVRELAGRTKLNEPGTNALSGSDSTLLTLALSEATPASIEIVRVLLKAGANPNQASEKGWTIPLVRAIQLKKPELVAVLLDAGANPNQQDPNGGVAYYVALDNVDDSSLAIFETLLVRGANLEAVDKGGKTALMVAAIYGNWKAMDILLKRGARWHAKDEKGKTALDYTEDKIGELERSRQTVDPGLRAMLEGLR